MRPRITIRFSIGPRRWESDSRRLRHRRIARSIEEDELTYDHFDCHLYLRVEESYFAHHTTAPFFLLAQSFVEGMEEAARGQRVTIPVYGVGSSGGLYLAGEGRRCRIWADWTPCVAYAHWDELSHAVAQAVRETCREIASRFPGVLENPHFLRLAHRLGTCDRPQQDSGEDLPWFLADVAGRAPRSTAPPVMPRRLRVPFGSDDPLDWPSDGRRTRTRLVVLRVPHEAAIYVTEHGRFSTGPKCAPPGTRRARQSALLHTQGLEELSVRFGPALESGEPDWARWHPVADPVTGGIPLPRWWQQGSESMVLELGQLIPHTVLEARSYDALLVRCRRGELSQGHNLYPCLGLQAIGIGLSDARTACKPNDGQDPECSE